MGMGASMFTAFDSIVYNRSYNPNEMSDLIYQLVLNATGTEKMVAERHRKKKKGREQNFADPKS
jgi:hypothetical protein